MYIVTIPDIGDPAEHIISGIPPSWMAASSAMSAKVGVAASDSHEAALALPPRMAWHATVTTPRDF
jgi:hypothetical protein